MEKTYLLHPVRNTILIVIFVLIVGTVGYMAISNYLKTFPRLKYTLMKNDNKQQNPDPNYPDFKFAVISDLHYYDPKLGTTGAAFEEYLDDDRKLLADSSDLLNFAIDDIIWSGVKNVLIPGDLTKDGELVDHQDVAKALERLKANGIQAYVIPGNHDINNPHSYRYLGSQKERVPTISADDFAAIYQDFGYKQAIYRDPNSLSYVVEPTKGLWLVCLDDCEYKDNNAVTGPIVAGKFTQSLENWLENILNKAHRSNIAVMVMIHHGVVEHWVGQSKLHPDYLVEDYSRINQMLASYGVRLAFTGHYHAQDISKADYKQGGYIIDIETGSLVTPNCPVRYCSISNNKLTIKSKLLIKTFRPGTGYEEYADKFIDDGLVMEIQKKLSSFFVPKKDAAQIAAAVGKGFIAHYHGDENKADEPKIDESKLSILGKIVLSTQDYVIKGLWNDTPMSDNNSVIDLKTGKQIG